MKRVIAAAIGTALALTGLAGTAGAQTPAQAQASCSGLGCDNKDPQATGCATSAGAVKGSGFNPYNGYLEMRFGNCQTNWARFTVSEAGRYAIWVERQASSGIPATEGNHFEFDGSSAGGPYWSDQLYAPNQPYTQARVCISRHYYPWWDNKTCSPWL